MSALSNSPEWQRARAALLHGEFLALAESMRVEGAALVASLEALAARLSGRMLPNGQRAPKPLRVSASALKKAWYRWDGGGRKAAALMPKYGSPQHVKAMPALLVSEIQRLASSQVGGADKDGKGLEAPTIRKWLSRDWLAGKPLPGVGTWQEWWRSMYPALPLPATPPAFPWSDKTILRKMGSRVVQKMGNIGEAAAKNFMPSMQRDYSELRRCELYMLDDVRLDVVAIEELTGRVVTIVCYILIEVASRSIVAFVLKPKHAIRAEDVDELLAHALQTEGYGVGIGYVTHIWFERGTIACSKAAQTVLEAGSEGAIKIHRTGMNGGIRWVGAAMDRKSGHAAGKAVIESFNRNLHRRLKHLPGQRGNNHTNQPANLGVGDKEVKDPSKSGKKEPEKVTGETLRLEAERLQQFKLAAMVKGEQADLKLPLLTVSQLHAEVATAIRGHNTDRGHGMQGFHTIQQAEVAPGVWRDLSNS